ncbi:MAG: hypothetical protein II304_03075 [Bacteroidales bacterium]|nr:hypothetical protein [Bacteroidales bacterium]
MINISAEDAKLFQDNGFTKDQIGTAINHYREQGLSDDDIQAKINNRLSSFGKVTSKKGIDLTPSGIAKGASVRASALSTAPFVAAKQNIPFGEAYRNELAEFEKAQKALENPLSKANDFLIDTATYSLLPVLRVAKGAGLLPNIANMGVTGAYQGAITGGLESLKQQGNLSGIGTGAGIGASVGGGLPVVGKVAQGAVRILPSTGGFFAKTIGRLKPETLAQAVKPESQALDLTEAQAQNLLMNTTENIQNSYRDLVNRRGQTVNNAIKALPADKGVPISDLKQSLTDIYNDFSISGNPELNVAVNEAGGLYNYVNDLINKTNKSKKLKENILNKINDYEQINTAYNQEAENEAFDILKNATGKNANWLKSQLKSDSTARGMEARKDFIENLLNNVDDKLDINAVQGQYKNYNLDDLTQANKAGNETIGRGEEIARKAYSDIMNKSYNLDNLPPLERGLMQLDQNYNNMLKNALATQDEKAFTKLTDDFMNELSAFPDDVQADYINKFSQDMDEIYAYKNYANNPTASAGEVKEILRNLDARTPRDVWGKPANTPENKVIKRLYGAYNDKLSELSPELAQANREFAALKNFEENEGVKGIIRPNKLHPEYELDSAARTLRNYNSTITSGNKNRNINDLEKLLVAEGYEPFLNKVDDVNAAMDLNNARTTGDSWLANIATQATRPALKRVRELNRKGIPAILDKTGQAIQRILPPNIARTAPLLYGGVEYNERY